MRKPSSFCNNPLHHFKIIMTQTLLKILLACACVLPISSFSQHIEYGHIFSSDLENRDKEKVGKGDMQFIAGSITLPLSIKRDSTRGIRTWILTVSGKYATMDHEGGATFVHPEEIINTGMMLTHVRSLSAKWNMIATAGVSLNAPSDYIRTNSISLTAGTIFSYRVNSGLNLGIGLIATTSYGEVVCLPVPFITWKKKGRINYELNMRGMPEFRISTQVTPKFQLALSPFDAERFSAVITAGNSHKNYTNNLIKTTLEGSYHIAKHVSVKADVGYVYYHKAKIVNRTAKAFWSNMFSNKNANKYKPSFTFSVGLQYRI